MLRYIKRSFVLALFLLGVLVMLAVSYDFFYMQKKIKQYDILPTAYPASFKQLALTYYQNNLSYRAADFIIHPNGERRTIETYLAGKLLNLHLNADAQLKIVAKKIYLGEGCNGFESASMHYYHRPFYMLNAQETASLITLSNAPNAYLRHTELHRQATNLLLNSVGGSSQ